MAKDRICPRCKAAIRGYVDECPSCGFEKPVPLPWHMYGLMVLILVAAMWLLIDLESIARVLLSAREGLRAL
ncbi:MAG: hypothetical protein OEN55_09300 [Alphaproteobacteria bacterium]|nr:hypothetical protein [Alphaproteobacteria bacterium]